MEPAKDPSTLVEELVRDHRGELVAFVRRRAGHIVDPDDVVQQAALRALARGDQLRDPARARAWLFRIVRNALVDELRAIGLPVSEPLDDTHPAEPPDERGEACRCALEVAKQLKPEYSAILERAVIDDVPVTAVAGELGITPNNAMVRLHRARNALRTALQAHCGTESLRACLNCVCHERGCCAGV